MYTVICFENVACGHSATASFGSALLCVPSSFSALTLFSCHSPPRLVSLFFFSNLVKREGEKLLNDRPMQAKVWLLTTV